MSTGRWMKRKRVQKWRGGTSGLRPWSRLIYCGLTRDHPLYKPPYFDPRGRDYRAEATMGICKSKGERERRRRQIETGRLKAENGLVL